MCEFISFSPFSLNLHPLVHWTCHISDVSSVSTMTDRDRGM